MYPINQFISIVTEIRALNQTNSKVEIYNISIQIQSIIYNISIFVYKSNENLTRKCNINPMKIQLSNEN